MAITIPQSQRLQPIQVERKRVPVEQIIAVKGQSPIATGISTLGDVLGKAMERKRQLQQQAVQMAAIQAAFPNETLPEGTDPETAMKLIPLKAQYNQEKVKAQKQEAALKPIRQYEKENGLVEGSLGDDPTTARLLISQHGMGERQEAGFNQKDRDRKIRENKTILDWKSKMRNDPQIKPLYQQQLGLSQVSEMADLAKGGNTVASNAIGAKMARAMGEVGVLTDNDVVRYARSGRLDRKAADTLSGWINGRPTVATLSEMDQISNILRDSFQTKVQPVYNDYIETLARNMDLTPDEAAFKLAVPYMPVKPKLNPLPMPGQLPGGKKTPEQEAEEFLRGL